MEVAIDIPPQPSDQPAVNDLDQPLPDIPISAPSVVLPAASDQHEPNQNQPADAMPPIADLPVVPAVDPPPPAAPIPPLDGEDDDDGSGSEHETDDGDGEEDSSGFKWRAIEEDKSVPCEDELRYIAEKEEHSTLDDEYWDKQLFEDQEDHEIKLVEQGVLDWTIDAFNGTEEQPNKELLMRSPKVTIGGLEWQIKFYPHGHQRSDYLSVYIECTTMLEEGYSESSDFVQPPFPFLSGTERLKKTRAVATRVALFMYNPAEPRTYEYQNEVHHFHKHNADFGWKYFTRHPRCDFHIRQHGTRAAILRDDKLAFRARIRVLDDTTGCLWQHDNMSIDRMISSTGLRPFSRGSPYVASIVPLLHVKSFRDVVKQIDHKTSIGRWLHSVLLKMYTRMRSSQHGMSIPTTDGDAVEIYLLIMDNIKETFSDLPQKDELLKTMTHLFGSLDQDHGMVCGSNRLQTKEHASVQTAVNNHKTSIETPSLLILELERQEHDKKDRKWKKITNNVTCEDRITVNGTGYTLFAFTTHCGTLQSGRYSSFVRPRGIGNGWYRYQNGAVVRLTEKQARKKHSGGEKDNDNDSGLNNIFTSLFDDYTAIVEVTTSVIYVRDDQADTTFNAPDEEAWDLSYLEEANPPPPEPTEVKINPPADQQENDAMDAEAEEAKPAETESEMNPEPEQAAEPEPVTFSTLVERAAAAATPEPPSLMDGDDTIMSDVEDSQPTTNTTTDPAPAATSVPQSTTVPQSDLQTRTIDWLGRPYYHGQFHAGKYHGRGHLISTNGDEYTGTFEAGQQSGSGRMIYAATGDVYDGTWEAGEHHGQGTLTEHATGNVFTGGWKAGRKHGAFVLKGEVTVDDRSCCTICYDREIATAFYDCGHVLACRDCAALIEVCPVCRRRVLSRLQLYGVKMTLA